MAATLVQSQGPGYLTFGKHHETFQDHPQSKSENLIRGFPARYTGERVWDGSEMALKQHEWVITLSEEELLHIEKALRFFQGNIIIP